MPDSGLADSGTTDAGVPDSGVPDSGVNQNLGSLTVTLSGAPGDAAVQVSGPNGFAQSVTASRTLTDLAPGTYTLTASAVRQSGQIVDTVFDPAPRTTTAPVVAGETATVPVTYAVRPGTGALYVPSPYTGEIIAYTDAMLAGAGPLLADGGLASPPANATTLALKFEDGGTWMGPEVVSVDAQGQLWAALNDEGSQVEGLALFSGTQQATGGTLAPQSFLSPSPTDGGALSIEVPLATTFDEAGNLWVANSGHDTSAIVVIGKTTLASDAGTAVADLRWAVPAANGLAFDRDGNLWYSSCTNSAGIFQIAEADLNAVTPPAPAVSIANDGDHSCPENIAFDSAGNLYVAECGVFIGVSKYPSWQLADGGSNGTNSEPAVTVTNPHFQCVTGVAVDNADNVWVTDYEDGTGVLYEFSKDQLESSGSPDPLRAFGFGTCDYCGIAFNPPGTNLPMAQ